ncbi:Hypothetical protein D9617_6g094130 [Elsinoe fawcettii]|nr:Hypothetical protein D9617_6g094130 [Elsinoe fawcettii]
MTTTSVPLPATNGLLGRTLNSLSYNAWAFDDVVAHGSQSIAVPMLGTSSEWTIPGSKVTYTVPDNVKVHYTNQTDHDSLTTKGGEELIQKLEADTSLQGKYLAVSGKLAVKASLEKEVKQSGMYAYVTSVYERYNAVLDFGTVAADALLSSALILELENLPRTFDPSNADNYQTFVNFVKKWGTHLVVGVTYGQRYTLKSETLTNNEEVKKNFEVNVKAAYSTVLTKVEADANVKGSQEYKTFEESTHWTTQILGGDSLKHAALSSDPLNLKAYIDWSSSAASPGQETPLCVHVQPLYELIATYGPRKAQAPAAIVAKAVELFISPPTISSGMGAYDGPCLWQSGDSRTPENVKITFSGDPFFRIWRKSPYKVYDTHASLADNLQITDDGKTLTWTTRGGLAGGVGYYHAGAGLEYCFSRPVDVKMEASKFTHFYYGEPEQKTAPSGKTYNGYATLDCPAGQTKEWKQVDLRKGPIAAWNPSLDAAH